jgi:uncharacterized protein YdhG (YjbR/CyaY superfamily)
MAENKLQTIDQYIATLPEEAHKAMEEVRQAMQSVNPALEEGISYGIAAFKLDGKFLIYFAGYKKHIGIYPVPNDEPEFEKDFATYKTSGKGAIQFPLNKPMPLELIKRIVKYRIKNNQEKKVK